jgi:hypothetical protein
MISEFIIMIRSFVFYNGAKYYYCNECIFGGNGYETCWKGGKIKNPVDAMGCSEGKLLSGIRFNNVTLFDME